MTNIDRIMDLIYWRRTEEEQKDVSWLALFLDSFVPAFEKLGQTSWIRFIAELLSNGKLSQALKESTREIFTKHPPYR